MQEPEGYKQSALETLTTPESKGGNKFYDRGSEQSSMTPYQELTVPKNSRQEQERLASKETINFLMKAMADPNADPQKIQMGLTALQTLTKGYEPKKEK